MDDLCFEIKSKIVKQLFVYDALKLRRLNKGWKSVVDQRFKIQNLSISYIKNLSFKWLGGDELVDCDFINYDVFKIEQFRTLLIDRPYFANLKCLLVQIKHHYDIRLVEQINQLKTLESLEIIGGRLAHSNGEHLLLPNLQYFRADDKFWYGVRSSDEPNFLSIESAKLRKVKLDRRDTIDQLKFVHPSSVEYLESEYLANKFTIFKNLKILIIYQNWFGLRLDDFLLQLPLLEEVHTNSRSLSDELVEQKKRFKRDELRVFCDGVNCDLLQHINRSDYEGRECRRCRSIYCPFSIINERSLISRFSEDASNLSTILPFENDFFYRHLEAYLDDGRMLVDRSLLSGLMEKFINLTHIYVYDLCDARNLSVILDSCRTISMLMFEKCSIGQHWFDRLPERCPRLGCLRLYRSHVYDFRFLFRFNCLTLFDTNINLSYDLLDELEHARIICRIRKYFCYCPDPDCQNDFYDYESDESGSYQNDDSEYVLAKENRKYRIKKKFCSKKLTNSKDDSRPAKRKGKRKKRGYPIEMDLDLSLQFKC